MAVEFVMPKLGLTMEAGTIVRWLVDDGADVQRGQAVLIIETDKVESEVEATAAGRLNQQGSVGEEYPCGANLGWFLAEGETPPTAGATASGAGGVTSGPSASPTGSGLPPSPPSGVGGAAPAGAGVEGAPSPRRGSGGRILASPNARRLAADTGVDLDTVVGTGPGNRITADDVLAAAEAAASGAAAPAPAAAVPTAPAAGTAPTAASGEAATGPLRQPPASAPSGPGVLATIAARNLANLLGVDLAQVAPSGPDQRVSRDDVAAHVRARLAAATAEEASASPAATSHTTGAPPLQQPSSVIPLTGMRGTIASRMSESLHSMAQLTLTMDVDMDGVVADRARRAEKATPPGYTDYVIAATAQALVEHPVVNSQVTDDGVALLPSVHVGLAVALDHGLIVPVIRDTLSYDLDALAAETTRLATAARDRTLTLADLEGGTFSVTALGMFGVDAFTPIISAPNTAILGVGRIRRDVVLDDTGDTDGGTRGPEPRAAHRLTLSLTWDHRAFDGAPAAAFAQSVKRRLEAYG